MQNHTNHKRHPQAMRKAEEFLKTVRAKKSQLVNLLKGNIETKEANILIKRIELLNMVVWEFGDKINTRSLKNLKHRAKILKHV